MNAGSSYRRVGDISEDEKSLFIHPMGQAGNVLSGGFDGLLDVRAEDEYLPMRPSDYEVEETLTLSPGG